MVDTMVRATAGTRPTHLKIFLKFFPYFKISATHHLHLQDRYFHLIKQGKKKKEGRTNSGISASVQIGDFIEFHLHDKSESVVVKATEIKKYKTFKELLLAEGIEQMLPGSGLTLEEAEKLYQGFPSYKEREAQFGTLCIHFELL
ncbi:hypothetical protein HDV04_003813 [Boothiomyces sp. JEL0838]|nr:hypothetical protein HDV04_003813 [Boothiomyces sp. JEL0838]